MKSHKYGSLETVKFAKRREEYHRNLDLILKMGYDFEDFVHYFPAFSGTLTLNRYLTLYELYKQTLGVAGHICEVGVYKAASTILFGKLVQMYEPDSLVMVHGIDHFKGTDKDTDAKLQVAGGNCEDEERVRRLISLQNLDDTIKIHNLDAKKDFPKFFDEHPHLRFKLVFLDSGTYSVTSASIKALWHRITPGGVLILDQFNMEVAPGETKAVIDFLPNAKVETIPNSWMPNAYIRKPYE